MAINEIIYSGREIKKINLEINVNELSNGITAYIRLKDESQTLKSSLLSILGLFDHYVVLIQPSSDKTVEIVKTILKDSSVTLIHYPFDSWPNGPGYNEQDEKDMRSRTFFYNFGCKFIPTKHACKWDGDMVASDSFKEYIKLWKKKKNNYVSMKGVECANGVCSLLNNKVFTGSEIRIFKLEKSNFINGPMCEQLSVYRPGFLLKVYRKLIVKSLDMEVYYHFKYAKIESSRTKAWPENWRDIEHFIKLYNFSEIENRTMLPVLNYSILE